MAAARGQCEREAGTGGIGLEMHLDCVIPVDIARCVVDGIVEVQGIGVPVRQGQRANAGCICECRSKAAEQVGRRSVLKCVAEAGSIGPGSAARPVKGTKTSKGRVCAWQSDSSISARTQARDAVKSIFCTGRFPPVTKLAMHVMRAGYGL